jgi:hypothetical protein
MTTTPPAADRRDDVLGNGPEPNRRGLPPWLARGMVAALVAAVALVVGPDLLSSGQPPDRPEPDASASSAPTELLPASLRWPTRGDLAHDREFLDGVRNRVTGFEVQRVGEVLWAGTLRSGGNEVQAALVTGAEQKDAGDSVFVPVIGVSVRAGDFGAATVDRLRPMDLGTRAIGWRVEVGTSAVAVVVGRPARLEVEISPSLSYDESGVPHRQFTPSSADDGVVVAPLPADRYPAPAVADDAGVVRLLGPDESPPEVSPVIAGLRPSTYTGPPTFLLDQAVRSALRTAPLAGDDVTVRLLWSGPVGNGAAAVLLYTRADGATFHEWLASVLGATPSSGAYPVPRDQALTYPAVVDVQSAGPNGATAAVVDPVGPGTVTYVDNDGLRVTRRSSPLGVTVFARDEYVARDPGILVLHDRLGSRSVVSAPPQQRDPLLLEPAAL